MDRRNFLAAAGAAAATGAQGLSSSALAASEPGSAQQDRQLYELREYHMLPGPAQQRLHDFLEDVAVPAYNEIGVEPVGVWSLRHGQNEFSLYVLLPYDSGGQFLASRSRLRDQEAYAEAIDPPIEEPTFRRYESQLMRAFAGMPRVSVHGKYGPGSSRIHEMRTYESYNEERARRKVEMFDDGETAIFADLGHRPVWLGDTVIGDRMPQLTYMLAFEDMSQREAFWQEFLDHPDWQEMSQDPYYEETVSNITSLVLQPTGYSQI